MDNRNLNLFFWKTYYRCLSGNTEEFKKTLESSNKVLENFTFDRGKDYRACPLEGVSVLTMRTNYPGMIVGTGYSHGTGIDGANDDINCGFSFDYVSGLPYLPGSSVKGILRSVFRKCPAIITDRCGIPEQDVGTLEDRIFGGDDRTDGDDIFLDAVIARGDIYRHVLGPDYITPHQSEIKDPIPIRILKILPDVVLELRFLLKDTVIGGTAVTAERKLKLFCDLLEVTGAGAKTNVGYGTLEKIVSLDDYRKPPAAPQNDRGENRNGNQNGYQGNRGGYQDGHRTMRNDRHDVRQDARQDTPSPAQTELKVGDTVTCTLMNKTMAKINGRDCFGTLKNPEGSKTIARILGGEDWKNKTFKATVTAMEGKKITLEVIEE